MEEVSKHNTVDDLWLVVDKRIFDVTDYVDSHPGGEAILRGAGQDATVRFRGPQHPETVNELIEDYYIGYVVE